MIQSKFASDISNMQMFFDAISLIDSSDMRCSQFFSENWANHQPLLGNNVLLNCHLTRSTLILIALFINAGADLQVTCSEGLVCHDDIKSILIDLNLYQSPDNVVSSPSRSSFDVVVDCGAAFAHSLRPKYGFVELTHVPESHYDGLDQSVLSIDNSIIKKIETCLGTGDGFVRAFQQQMAKDGKNFADQTYVVFGYGKVGHGIVTCILQAGVPESQVLVIEKDDVCIQAAIQDGLQALNIDTDIGKIKEQLANGISCAITATGITGCVSAYLNMSDFDSVTYLVNMGTYDEWGANFPVECVLNSKKPFNFVLEYPTKVVYLDPIFTLLAYATINLIAGNYKQVSRLAKPLLSVQKEILDIWGSNIAMQNHVDAIWLEEYQKEKVA